MNLPDDTNLPFFSYGLFRPGQIGYSRIRPFVRAAEPDWTVVGELLERDGLPIIGQGDDQIPGWLIRFGPSQSSAAYSEINSVEPDRLYVWRAARVNCNGLEEEANVLFGRRPERGSVHPEYRVWEGEKEPLFTSAITVIEKSIAENCRFGWDLEPFFRLQMAYMLLWCAIERFVSFKYHLGDRVSEKVFKLADDPAFIDALRGRVSGRREVFRSDDPGKKEVLDRDRPKKALGYYYQIRSNITHRGKTAVRDHEMLLASLTELLDIFKAVLRAEFAPEPELVVPPDEQLGLF